MRITVIIGLIFVLTSHISKAQESSEEGVAFLISFFEEEPSKEELLLIEDYLESSDTLQQLMAISLLFRSDTAAYKEQMMDKFEVPYKNWKFKRGEMTCPSADEKADIDRQISEDLKKKYRLQKTDPGGISMLYTFIVYRTYNVWEWKSDTFAIPITIAMRGGYLNWLLSDMMDFKKQFISDMMDRNKAKSTTEEN